MNLGDGHVNMKLLPAGQGSRFDPSNMKQESKGLIHCVSLLFLSFSFPFFSLGLGWIAFEQSSRLIKMKQH